MYYYDKYGKITLLKGTILYHWSNEKFTTPYNNLFLCLDNSFWSDKHKIMYKYKVVKDINVILTIQNDNIINKQPYSLKDYEILTTICNDLLNSISYNKDDDVSLKTNKTNFPIFCDKLRIDGYEGLFNYIDSDKGQFEIVIFEPNNYLILIENKIYENVKLHKLSDCKRIMLSKKVNYIYPYNYEYVNKWKFYHYPSIFYYIYKKRISLVKN